MTKSHRDLFNLVIAEFVMCREVILLDYVQTGPDLGLLTYNNSFKLIGKLIGKLKSCVNFSILYFPLFSFLALDDCTVGRTSI